MLPQLWVGVCLAEISRIGEKAKHSYALDLCHSLTSPEQQLESSWHVSRLQAGKNSLATFELEERA